MSQREPTSLFYRLGKRIGYAYAANRHHIVEAVIGGIVRRLPGGALITRLFR